MVWHESLKKSGHFDLKNVLVENPILGVKMCIIRNWTIFAYTCKGLEVDPDRVFLYLKNLRKKYWKKVFDPRTSFDVIWASDLCKMCLKQFFKNAHF